MFWLALSFRVRSGRGTRHLHGASPQRPHDAAEALITWILSVACLGLLWFTYDYFI
jgi:hypothetical protein